MNQPPPTPRRSSHPVWLLASGAVALTLVSTIGLPLSLQRISSASASEARLTNSLAMQFVPIPDTDVAFCIHETRNRDYAIYAEQMADVDGSWKHQAFYNEPLPIEADHPVVGVSWQDAQAFCEWLSAREGKAYRLPTDREWSLAVGLGSLEKPRQRSTPKDLSGQVTNHWAWGTEWPPPKQTGNFADTFCEKRFPNLQSIPHYTDGYPMTAPVMSFSPNAQGLYDMGGNVQEWVSDYYSNDRSDRVERGGHYGIGDENGLAILSSRRDHHGPDIRGAYTGFRIVLELRTFAVR